MQRDAEKRADQWAFTANLHRDPERKRDPFTRADFMPAGTAPQQAPSTPDLLEKVRELNALFGGIDLTQQPNE